MLNFIFTLVMTKIKTSFGRGCNDIRLRMCYAHLFGGYLKSISYLFFFRHFLYEWVVQPCVYNLNDETSYVFKRSRSSHNIWIWYFSFIQWLAYQFLCLWDLVLVSFHGKPASAEPSSPQDNYYFRRCHSAITLVLIFQLLPV